MCDDENFERPGEERHFKITKLQQKAMKKQKTNAREALNELFAEESHLDLAQQYTYRYAYTRFQ